jgi:uncharacterized peroxidase-related enzyme
MNATDPDQDGGTGPHALGLPEQSGAALGPAMARYFERCEEKLGFVPNVLRSFSFDSAKLEAFVAYHNDLMLADSPLDKLEREMVAVVVSSQNHCYYCLTAHGAAVRQLSGDPVLGEQLVMNYRSAPLTDRQRAMLDFAVKLTRSPADIDAADRQRLRDAGLDDRAIWDLSAVVAFFNMTNRIAAAVDMQPNDAYHAMAR